jgi:hypothetical protein
MGRQPAVAQRSLKVTTQAQSPQRVSAGREAAIDLAPELLEVLREINAKLDRLLAARAPAAPLSRDDRAFLARLLPAAAGVLGSEPFHAAELCEHDAAALRLVCAGLSARRLGRLLRRAADIPIAGYVVKRRGVEAGAVLWQIFAAGNEKVSAPHVTSAARA